MRQAFSHVWLTKLTLARSSVTTNTNLQTERLLRADEVALLFNVNVSTVRRWAREGVIPSVRVTAKVIRFRESQIRALNTK